MMSDRDQDNGLSVDDKKKRKRKTKEEVERKFICPITGCEKSYG